jgi:hypothetical protein
MTSDRSSPFEDVSPATSSDALAAEYTVGVDLGQSFDPTAVAVIRKLHGGSSRPIFQVGHLERFPLQESYVAQVDRVGRLLAHVGRLGPTELVVDQTGVGAAVADLFQARGLSPIGIVITAGDTVTRDPDNTLTYRVPKLHLVSRLQACLHNNQLRIHRGLADSMALVEELQGIKAEVTNSGYWKFGARAGKHDDLVLSVAVALWRANGDGMQSRGLFEYYRQTYGNGAERAAEPQAAEPPPEPLPPDPFDFYSFGNNAAPADVVLKAPGHISAATGLSGRAYLPDARGLFTVTAEDAKPLVAHGWVRAT